MTLFIRSITAFALIAAAPAFAQSVPVSLWVDGGVTEFDLSGTGTSTVLGLRSDVSLSRFAAVEAGVGYTRTEQSLSDISYVLTDVEVQGQLPLGRVRPYLGVGTGYFWVLSESSRPVPDGPVVPDVQQGYDAAVLTASLGARIDVSGVLSARIGGRVRGTASGGGPDFFGSTISEATLGLGYRF